MRLILPLAIAALLPFQAAAQKSPPPAQNSGAAISQTVGQILFEAAEKAAIEEFYKNLPNNASGKAIKDAVEASRNSQSESDDDDDDRKGKRNKNWKKGNGQGEGKSKKMPPGLAKKKSLPPGLQKQLERNGTLPPGLAKRDLPDDLSRRLPPPRRGTERTVVGSDVVLIEQATGIVLDIIRDVIK